MRRLVYLAVLQLFASIIVAQTEPGYHPPLNIPMLLSGNFGELRSNHFHSGIDIKTEGRTGLPVYAAQEGYISRIKVQTGGYGKALYIAHPNGTTSVYGHLDRYRDDIAAFVKSRQYQKESQTLDLYLKSSQFPIERGALIAWSGNTGSSLGPHLHFELRSTAGQVPLNVLQYGFDIKDFEAPRFHKLYLYPAEETDRTDHLSGYSLHFNGSSYLPSNGIVRCLPGSVAFAVDVNDYLSGSANRCGIYSLDMYVDGELCYHHQMDGFSFSQTRYINAHIFYALKAETGISAHRLHRLRNNRLPIYGKMVNRGVVDLLPGQIRQIRIVASDVAGNQSELSFGIEAENKSPETPKAAGDKRMLMQCHLPFHFKANQVQMSLPADALYADQYFEFSESPPVQGVLGPGYHLHRKTTPLHKAMQLEVDASRLDPAFAEKYLFVEIDDDGQLHSAGGSYTNGKMIAKLRRFGTYAIAIDTLAPSIQKQQAPDGTELRFKISDERSGIASYRGYIDNKWALFEYDPKRRRLSYSFDEERIGRGQTHELELYVSDGCGNTNLYQSSFYY